MPKRPKCRRCGRQKRTCEEVRPGLLLCKACRPADPVQPDHALMRVLLDRARDGATNEREET